MLRRGVRSSLLAVLAILPHAADAQPQPLPQINLDSYPAVSRAPISGALDEARAHPDDAERVGQLGMVLQAWDQFDAAAAVYGRARELAPAFEWFYLGGLVEARLARHREAAQLLAEAVNLEPTSVPARLALADALFESGDMDGAQRQYGTLTSGASEPHARYGLGRTLSATGDHDAALRELETAVRLYPEFGAAWYARGMVLRRLGRVDDAKQSLAKAQQYGTQWPAVQDQVMTHVRGLREDSAAHANRAFAFQRQGDVSKAIEEYEAAVAVDPQSSRAHVNLIALYGGQREWSKAERHFRAVVALGLRVPEAHYNFAVCLVAQGDPAKAADEFRTTLEINPQYAPAWIGLAQIAERAGRIEEAESSYRKAAEATPESPATQFNIARMLIARRDYAQAIDVLGRIVKRDDPDQARFLFALGTAHVLAGDLAAGRKYATEARDLARSRGQTDLAAAIERDLAKLP